MSQLKTVIIGTFLLGACVSCASDVPPPVEYYQPAYRQSPPEPVYSRLMWSHLPSPIQPKSAGTAPLIMPVISFELPDATLEEAIEALAQTMGYRWDYPKQAAKRPIHIRMEGTIDEVLQEIGRQANVQTMLDHEKRLVRVMEKEMLPRLPGS